MASWTNWWIIDGAWWGCKGSVSKNRTGLIGSSSSETCTFINWLTFTCILLLFFIYSFLFSIFLPLILFLLTFNPQAWILSLRVCYCWPRFVASFAMSGYLSWLVPQRTSKYGSQEFIMIIIFYLFIIINMFISCFLLLINIVNCLQHFVFFVYPTA